ncbi:hypothetical protein XENOCAPTIV_005753, partial [Xenoophorus captivus]
DPDDEIASLASSSGNCGSRSSHRIPVKDWKSSPRSSPKLKRKGPIQTAYKDTFQSTRRLSCLYCDPGFCRHPAAGDSHEEQKAERAGHAGPHDRPATADDGQLPELHRSAGQQHLGDRPGRGPAPDADGGGKVCIWAVPHRLFY